MADRWKSLRAFLKRYKRLLKSEELVARADSQTVRGAKKNERA